MPIDEADWNENRAWMLQQLKREMYATAFSYEESQQVAAEADPMVLKAIESHARSQGAARQIEKADRHADYPRRPALRV